MGRKSKAARQFHSRGVVFEEVAFEVEDAGQNKARLKVGPQERMTRGGSERVRWKLPCKREKEDLRMRSDGELRKTKFADDEEYGRLAPMNMRIIL